MSATIVPFPRDAVLHGSRELTPKAVGTRAYLSALAAGCNRAQAEVVRRKATELRATGMHAHDALKRAASYAAALFKSTDPEPPSAA